jgi:hypothetical protein
MNRYLSAYRKSLAVAIPAALFLTTALLAIGQPRAQETAPPKPPGGRGTVPPLRDQDVPSPEPPPTAAPGEKSSLRRIGREDLETPLRLAKTIFEDLERRCSRDELIDVESAYTWSRRILEYELELNGEKGNRLAPYYAHSTRMRTIYHNYNIFASSGRIKENSVDMMKATFYRRDAINSLLRAGSEASRPPARK